MKIKINNNNNVGNSMRQLRDQTSELFHRTIIN